LLIFTLDEVSVMPIFPRRDVDGVDEFTGCEFCCTGRGKGFRFNCL
jgi:hypothetical protein